MDKYIKGVMLPKDCTLACVTTKERLITGILGIVLTLMGKNPIREISKREATTSDATVDNCNSFVDFVHDINSTTNKTTYSVVGSKGNVILTLNNLNGILNGFNKNHSITAFIQHKAEGDVIMFMDDDAHLRLEDLEVDYFK